jgi:hypothetical protein
MEMRILMNDDILKLKCASCGRTLMIGNIGNGSITVRCKCGTINLITVHPVINIQKVNPGIMNVNNEVIAVSLPKIKPVVVTIK